MEKQYKATVLALAALVFAGCSLEEDATRSAEEYSRELGYDVHRIACAGNDSDGDNYVSCTIVLKDGEEKHVECAAAWVFTLNTGCREPKINMRGMGGGR